MWSEANRVAKDAANKGKKAETGCIESACNLAISRLSANAGIQIPRICYLYDDFNDREVHGTTRCRWLRSRFRCISSSSSRGGSRPLGDVT